MATVHIAYDTETGRIVLLHRFAAESGDPDLVRRDAVKLAGLPDERVEVITVAADELEPTRLYRVDPDRRAVVAAGAGEDGVGFAVNTSRAPTDVERAGR